ncbi:MAG: CHASE2 domain-containing protein [Cyanomargarita calcarea GSE-NOS-MK-12-04C]|jgi:CHASE2 domain-containing sensor protein|uniref:CHASE2 domain-containing protein n=1 Tax=Cyanomargarita calcarea GSE-NOS-MK-12-04C TaxID=2839659 RepID=A0A951QUN5_9CYAN|nr:CHASE2 domain-containing protein [Cyanomargarita calcarea GSE-NOS-MK-12-04C]
MLKVVPRESIEIFFSYSQEDSKLRDKLANHLSILKRQKVITDWHEGEISAGQVSADEIEKHLNSARIILLLISSDFLASEKLWQRDVTLAMKRHDAEEACVIPVLLRPCEWKSAQFGGLQALPKNEEAITSWQNQDEAFKEVAKEIREAIEAKSDYISIPRTSKRLFKIPWRSLRTTVFTSVPITLLVIVMRVMGIFEASELLFFNRMMRNQQAENKDSKLLLVEITDDDREYYRSDKNKKKYGSAENGASLPDKVILELLNKLIEKKPRVIGLDISRDFSAKDELAALFKKDTEKSKLLIFVCKFPSGNDKGVAPPGDIPIEQVGLSDLLEESDGVIRRQLITMGTPETTSSKCRNKEKKEMESFSFKVAQKYLAKDNKPYSKPNKDDSFKSGNTVLQPLDSLRQGGYNKKGDSFDGYQILLNYRSLKESGQPSPQNIALKINVQGVLNGLISKDQVEDKIVLIGTPINSFDKKFHTPFSSGGSDPQMWGLYIQAQMVSQLVSAVSDESPRPLLKAGFITDEILLILIGSVVGSILPQLYKQSKYFLFLLGGTYVFCILSFCFICFLFFSLSTKYWIPLFSPTCAFTLSLGGVIILVELQSPKKIKL